MYHHLRPIALILSGIAAIACAREAAPPREAAPAPAPAPAQSSAPPPVQPPPQSSIPKVPVLPSQKPASQGERVPKTFSVYALSRGKGVPPEARDAQQKVEALVDADRKRGVRVTTEATRIGLEGERRLCVTYQNAREGTRALQRARAIVKGIDLVNLVEEPCTPRPKNPREEEP